MAEGFSHQLLLLLRLNQNTSVCVAAGDVMAQKLLKAASLGNPTSGSPDHFSPLLDCYSRAAWKRLRGFWLGSHTLPVETANVNPLNSNAQLPCFFLVALFENKHDFRWTNTWNKCYNVYIAPALKKDYSCQYLWFIVHLCIQPVRK